MCGIFIGLDSIIIGEMLFGTRNLKNYLISLIFDSIAYRAFIALVLKMGIPQKDLKLFKSILVAASLFMPLYKAKLKKRKVA